MSGTEVRAGARGQPHSNGRGKTLVVVLNEIRGSRITLQPLLQTGLSQLDWTLAYCGAAATPGDNPYSGVAKYLWEFDEPADWLEELKEIVPEDLYRFFLDPNEVDGISTFAGDIQLWISAWIQILFRFRALEKINELGLEEDFDWIFFVRSDYLFSSPIPATQNLKNPNLVLMAGDSYGGLNDRFLGFPATLGQVVRKALDYRNPEFVGEGQELFHFMRMQSSRNPETLLWYSLNKSDLIRAPSFVCQMGMCVRPNEEMSRWSTGYWSKRRRAFVKYPTELLLTRLCSLFGRFSSNSKMLNRLAKVSRAAGSQPRLLLAPMLALFGELQVGLEVFFKSNRETRYLVIQLARDFWKFCADAYWVLSGRRAWSPKH